MASGFGSFSRSSHWPKRTIVMMGSETKKSMPGIAQTPGNITAAELRAAASDAAERPSIDAENARKP